MNQTQHEVTDPCLLRLDANTDCTVILPRDEAVTGLRNGDLVVWSLRTGQPSRQLLSGTGVHAHNKEVKAVVLSEDNRYLVSASADGTLKCGTCNRAAAQHAPGSQGRGMVRCNFS
uniref:Uncharacterized protein LOC111123916 n=1 Tax=Crassostrea virginica TaxID=6565 RepID=A0A8B8D3P9_CRAVI|nr:uncharacterized protein LOC111123916 [Crassostrea virginica]